MPRAQRVDIADYNYHIINRASARLTLFESKDDYGVFESVLVEAVEKYDMRLIAYCCMPNHFHLILKPRNDGDLSKFMYWFSMTLTLRWHAIKKTLGSGHIFQGRYKSFLVQDDDHLLTVIRYVERNPLRAKLVNGVDEWKYSSLYRRVHGSVKQKKLLTTPDTALPEDYMSFVQTPLTSSELESVQNSVNKGVPQGKETWRDTMVDRFKLQATMRGKGRPKKCS
ncbi:MAG: putative transposase [Candidatus Paceibacteria bacterium]|jgi:putative transposase